MHNIASPRTDDSAIEQEIVAKGKTAPRVTPADIEANIAQEYYFTAADGAATINSNHGQLVYDGDKALDLLTFCVLVLRNGFTVTGESACASPENFDAEIGRKIARENAKQKCWPLMGYTLKEQLYQATQPAKTPDESTIPPHQQRVIAEKAELDEKLSKLLAFFDSETYKAIPGQDQQMLQQQSVSMEHYSEILGMRIEGFGIQP
jgi:hypothetical protein